MKNRILSVLLSLLLSVSLFHTVNAQEPGQVRNYYALSEIPDPYVWLAESIVFGISDADKEYGTSLYKDIFLKMQEPMYTRLGDAIAEETGLNVLSAVWTGTLNDKYRGAPHLLHETVLLGYLNYIVSDDGLSEDQRLAFGVFASKCKALFAVAAETEKVLQKSIQNESYQRIIGSLSIPGNDTASIIANSLLDYLYKEELDLGLDATADAAHVMNTYNHYADVAAVREDIEGKTAFLEAAREKADWKDFEKASDAVIAALNESFEDYLAGHKVETEHPTTNTIQAVMDIAWDVIVEKEPLLASVNLTKAGMDLLLNTTDVAENNIKMLILTAYDGIFRPVLSEALSTYIADPKDENSARAFIDAFEAYIKWQIYCCDLSSDWLEAFYSQKATEKGAVSQFFNREDLKDIADAYALNESSKTNRKKLLTLVDDLRELYMYRYSSVSESRVSSVTASSAFRNYAAGNLIDHDPATAWFEGVEGTGEEEYITFFVGDDQVVGIEVLPGYTKSEAVYKENGAPDSLLVESGESSVRIDLGDYEPDFADPGPKQYYLDEPLAVKDGIVRVIIASAHKGTKSQHTGISELHLLTGTAPESESGHELSGYLNQPERVFVDQFSGTSIQNQNNEILVWTDTENGLISEIQIQSDLFEPVDYGYSILGIRIGSRMDEVLSILHGNGFEFSDIGYVKGSAQTGVTFESEEEKVYVSSTQMGDAGYTSESDIDRSATVTMVVISRKTDGAQAAFSGYPRNFVSTGGAGGRADMLTVNADGSFTGTFVDGELGDCADQYPNGTNYICEYSGRFVNVREIDEMTFELEVETVRTEHSEGEVWYKDGYRYIAVGTEVITPGQYVLYKTGTPVYKLVGNDDILMVSPGWWNEDSRPEFSACDILWNKTSGGAFFEEYASAKEEANSDVTASADDEPDVLDFENFYLDVADLIGMEYSFISTGMVSGTGEPIGILPKLAKEASKGKHSDTVYFNDEIRVYVQNDIVQGIAVNGGKYCAEGMFIGSDIQSASRDLVSEGWSFSGNTIDGSYLVSRYRKDDLQIFLEVDPALNRNYSDDSPYLNGSLQQVYVGYSYDGETADSSVGIDQTDLYRDPVLAGRWIPGDINNGYVDFSEEGRFEICFEGDTLQTEWHTADGEVIFSYGGEETAMSYSIEDQNHLRLDGELFIREGFHEAQKAADAPASSPSSYFQQLAGAWYLPGAQSASFVLYDDGTCEIRGEYGLGSWGVVNGNIFKLSNFYGETETAQIDYIGNGRLEISGYGNTQTFYNKPNQP